uniref:Shugoshin_C domain-containing protein n=1 Tax=Strongyloides papillosus TaxID=174720 RepID=A0A0N5C3B4_STREA
MGNCVISGKKKCKIEEVYTKRLSLIDSPINRNNVNKKASFNVDKKEEINLVNEVENCTAENRTVNQSNVKESVNSVFLDDDDKKNGNTEVGLTYEPDNPNDDKNGSNEVSLTYEPDNHDDKENGSIEINLPCESDDHDVTKRSSSIKSLPEYSTPVGTPTVKGANFLNDDRPIQPMPTPFRISAVTPGRRIENLCDHKGRLRKDIPFRNYLARKRGKNLFAD